MLRSLLPILAEKTDAPQGVDFMAKYGMMILLFGMVALFMLMSFRNKQRDERKRRDMLNQIKRGDRVQTIGGILGTVVEARETEVVLKIDEASNTKIRFIRSAIHRVVEEEKQAAAK